MLPRLVIVPVPKLLIPSLTVKVAVAVVPPADETQPPVKVMPPTSGVAL